MIYVNYISIKLEKKEGSFQWQKTQEGTNCGDLNMSLKLCAYMLSCDQLFDTLCPWDSPGKNTGVGCHCLLQGIFPTQGSNLHLLYL